MERIIIYGAGKIGRQYYEFLKLQKMDHIIEAFCDRNYKQIGKIGMAAVKDYHKLKGKGLPFVIAVFDSQEICELLQDEIYIPMKEKEMAAFLQVLETGSMIIRKMTWKE